MFIFNAGKAQYKEGGDADWYGELRAIIQGVLGDVYCEMVYADLGSVRGEKMAKHPVKDIRPEAAEYAKMSVLDRINYELTMRDIGIRIGTFSLLDYELNDQFKPFEAALQKRAISKVNLETSQNEATAANAILEK